MLPRQALSPRRMPRQVRSRRMVAAILEAAALVFVEVGYENASTNHIAQRAGVSVGSLYQFFPNKGALLATLQAQWTERLGQALDVTLGRSEHRDLGGIVDDVLDVHANLNASPPGLLGLLLTAPPLTPEGETVRVAVQHRLEDILSRRAPHLGPARR
ncbi:TetR/AcrR family transcriptional regulator, partial [Deinococcus pimensis]|uniref:TetR/AcrR family transcriptional regulator n=1 Tax=Deinococcus pimensis TaxID=309888 RepID=UPI0009FE0C03